MSDELVTTTLDHVPEELTKIINTLPASVTVNLDLLKKTQLGKKPKVISSVSEKEQEVFRFFSSHSPCWFAGCEELRKDYVSELARLGPECPSCQKGSVIKQFKPKVEALLEKHYATNKTN